jgi:hypothetical protein
MLKRRLLRPRRPRAQLVAAFDQRITTIETHIEALEAAVL